MDTSTIIILFMGFINLMLLVALIYVVTRFHPVHEPMIMNGYSTPYTSPRHNTISSFPATNHHQFYPGL